MNEFLQLSEAVQCTIIVCGTIIIIAIWYFIYKNS